MLEELYSKSRIHNNAKYWIVRCEGLLEEEKPLIVIASTKRYALRTVLPRVSDLLELKHPEEMWLEDLDDAKGKDKFTKESFFHPEIFIRITKLQVKQKEENYGKNIG